MKRLFWRIVHLQKCFDQFSGLAQRHKEKCEELYFVNPEQAQAQWEQCVFWVGKAERVYAKLKQQSGYLTRVLHEKYGRTSNEGRKPWCSTSSGERPASSGLR